MRGAKHRASSDLVLKLKLSVLPMVDIIV